MESDGQVPEGASTPERIEAALARLRRPRRGGFPGGPASDGPLAGGPFGTGALGSGFGPRGPFGPHRGHGEHGGHGGAPWHRDEGVPGGPARFRLLDALESGGRTITELAEAIGVDQPRASRLVAFGVRGGVLRKRADPSDARRALVELTDAGRATLDSARARRRGALERGLAGFTPEEADRFADLLTRFADGWAAEERGTDGRHGGGGSGGGGTDGRHADG